jgi:hypothetical protein
VDEANPPKRTLCKECELGECEYVRPLILEWAEDSDLVGDFTWPCIGVMVVIVTDRVRQVCLDLQLSNLRFDPITFYQHPRLKRPTRITSRTKPRVWLPYEGPTLWDMQPLHWVHLNAKKSRMSLDQQCSTCGYQFLQFEDINKLHIDSTDLGQSEIFRIYELPSLVFCTSRVKTAFEAMKFTNIKFSARGTIEWRKRKGRVHITP